MFLAVLVIGLILSKKHNFKAGFYFFLILIIDEYVLQYLRYYFIDTFVANRSQGAAGMMTIGEIVVLVSYIPKLLEIVAFSILIVGLFRMWQAKGVSTRNNIPNNNTNNNAENITD